jgi:hypothetical protein
MVYLIKRPLCRKILEKSTAEPVISSAWNVLPARPASDRKRCADEQILGVARAAEEAKRLRRAEVDGVLGSSSGGVFSTKSEAVDIGVSMSDTNSATNDAGVNNKVEALKSLLMARRKAELEEEERKAALRAVGIEQERLQRIPLFCDVLRMFYQRQKRTSVSYHHVITTLSKETRHSREEIKKLVDLLCEMAPEFVSIIPPDEIVSEPYIRLNEYCDYKTFVGNIKARIQQMLSSSKK